MAKPTPVVTVRPRYEPFIAASTTAPTAAMPMPVPRGTGSRRRTRCTVWGLTGGGGPARVPLSAAAGSVTAVACLPSFARTSCWPFLGWFRAQPEHLGPEDDDAEENRVEQDVVVVAAGVAAQQGLGDADRQPDRDGAPRPPEGGEPGGD